MMDNNNAGVPASHLDQFEIGGNDTGFTPVNAGYVGTGAMDPPPASFQSTPSGHADPNANAQLNAQLPWYQRAFACLQITSLQQYFDVDTADIQERITGSILHANKADHFRVQILTGDNKTPDLYGPVWLCMTLVFLFAVTSNTSKYLHTDSLTDFEYDISHLTHAMSIVTFYTFVLPALLFVMLKCIKAPLSLVEIVSIYGYSLVPYLPVTILCLVPSVLLEWMFLLIATGVSMLLIMRNILGPVMRSSVQWAGPISMYLAGCHLIFCFVLKFTFYRHKYHAQKGGGTTNTIDDGLATDDGM